MAREKKPVELRAIDEDIEKPVPIRLENPETARKEKAEPPIRLGRPVAGAELSQRLELPTKEGAELRTHQPGVEAILELEPPTPDLPEQHWGETPTRRKPIAWGWFALVAMAIAGAALWSTSRVKKADLLAAQIRHNTQSQLLQEAKEESESGQLIERIEKSLRDFFGLRSVAGLTRMVRHPQRVAPLMGRYYSEHPGFFAPLKTIKRIRPLPLDTSGNFWLASVILADDTTRHLMFEILASGEVRIDWESLMCYQPMKWDDFALQRPPGTSLDFRVYVEQDHFFSHEFADSQRWSCFRLTALDSEETLFGYAPTASAEAQALLKLLENQPDHKAALILRLSIPEQLQSRRGVVIEKLLSPRWIYLDPPEDAS